ncbi:ROK family protein [Croceicoccus mobilis]|uniref:fructokinase n=1 Tax=Croceicoccus mobilis TaxID=1703339 RepID=A0A916YY39_9SPHN|nr:ROK family protein [Croceicoccus mobilis]GGD67408.1 fructokinase [Croceicoccus mobilis]
MSDTPGVLGAIEAGGTKFLCAIAGADGRIIDELRIPTETPEQTLGAAGRFFAESIAAHGSLAALGIGSFGPLSLNPAADDYGHITTTPKPGWQNADLIGHFREVTNAPIAFDTDVNCAAIGEHLFGSGRGLDSFCYVTVGTGIGVGVFIAGAPHGGANHPEAGHIPLPRAQGDEGFAGICPFHGDCAEGMASGPAMRARWGQPAESLPDDHPAWEIEADYLAALCATLSYVVRPERIVLGGGVMEAPSMLGRVRESLLRKLGGYDASLAALSMGDYLAPPTAGASTGLTGALALAHRTAYGEWPAGWSPEP